MRSLPVRASAGPRVLWVTPLRALANDLAHALREPLEALGVPWTVEVRTGDTSSSARKKQRELAHAAMAGGSAASQPSQRRTGEKVGRNDPCPCGSGKKYKKCHGVEA